MRDNQLWPIILTVINTGLTARSISGVSVMQAQQPTRQGPASGRGVYLTRLPDVPIGHTKRDSVWNVDESTMDHVEEQVYSTTIQLNSLAIQDPADTTSLTAMDLARACRAVLQSSAALDTFIASGLGMLRIGEIRNTPFVDDKGRNEYSPSFDFTLTHNDRFISTDPVTELVECNVVRI